MRSWIRVVAVSCALLMVALAFQTMGAQAHLPNTGAGEYNHAAGADGAAASASGSSGSNLPGNAIDGSPSTYWQSSTTTGRLAVRFARLATIDEVHVHFTTNKYASLSLYADLDGDGTYETKVWSTTQNAALDVVAGLAPSLSYGIKVTIDLKVGPWLAQAVSTAAAAVASAVQAAARIVGQIVDWIVNAVVQGFQAAIEGLLSVARNALQLAIGGLIDLARQAVSTAEASTDTLTAIAATIIDLAQIIAFIPVAIRIAEAVFAIATLGVGFVALKAIGKVTGELIVRAISLVAISLVAEYLITQAVESYDWVATQTVGFFKGMGIGVSAAAGVGKIGLKTYQILREKSLLQRTPLWRWFGLGLSVISLMVLLYTVLFSVSPAVLFFLDLLAIALGFGGLLIYFTESLNFPNRAMDAASSMGATVEKVVVYCQLPIAFATVLAHSGTPGYGLNP